RPTSPPCSTAWGSDHHAKLVLFGEIERAHAFAAPLERVAIAILRPRRKRRHCTPHLIERIAKTVEPILRSARLALRSGIDADRDAEEKKSETLCSERGDVASITPSRGHDLAKSARIERAGCVDR